MAAQVIIQLVADPSGLQPGIQGLEQLEQVDQQAAAQARQTNQAFTQRAASVNANATATQRLTQATTTLTQSITGGAINQAAQNIERLSRNTQQATTDTRNYNRAIEEARNRLQTLSQGTAEFQRVSNEIEAAQTAMQHFTTTATSTRAQLRQLREALSALEEGGHEGTQIFQDLQVEAGALQDQIGDTQQRIRALASDTFALDGTIGVIQGVAGAFSVAQGAVALFGDENEDVQKALLKVNAAMAVLNGLQQLQNILQSQSVATLFVENQLRRLSAASIALQSAAESRFTIIRAAATLAQKALNAAMLANPATVLFAAVTLLAGAILLFTNNTDDAAKAQEDLNKELESFIKISELSAKAAQQQADVRIAELKRQRADSQKIREAETQDLRDQVLKAKVIYDKANANLAQYGTDLTKLTLDQLKQRLQAQQLQADASQKYFALENQLQVKKIQNQKDAEDDSLKSASAYAQARVALAKKGSQEELQAQINAIKVRQQEQLAAEGITEGERAQVIAENERAISELRLQAQQEGLNDQIKRAESHALVQRDFFLKFEAETAVLLLKAQRDSLGKSQAERLLIETQTNEAIRALRIQLFGDLQRTDKQEVDYFGKKQKEQVLLSAQAEQQKLEGKKQQALKSIEITQWQIQREKELRKEQEAAIIDGFSQLSSIGLQMAVDRAQAASDAEQAILKDKLERGLITQKEYDNQSRIIKRRQAQVDKQAAIFEALIATSVAVVKALSAGPFIGPTLAAITAALGAAQIAAIAARPIPAFKKGTKNAPGGPSLVGEAGPELIYAAGNWQYASKATVLDLPKGAKVIPTLETAKIMQKYDIPIPNIQQNVNTSIGGEKIDYNKLGHVIGKEIGKMPLNVFGFDKNGPFQYTTSMANRQSFLKKKFGTR